VTPLDAEDFGRQLDDQWLREHLRRSLPPPPTDAEVEALAQAAAEADSLGEHHRVVLGAARAHGDERSHVGAALRDIVAGWPARLVLATAACALLVIGLGFGIVARPLLDRHLVGFAPPPKPPYSAESRPELGVVAPVKAESERRFREAMKYYSDPDFARRALPLLRQAVEADPTNDRAHFWLGVALLLDGDARAAVPPLEAAARLAPADRQVKEYLIYACLQSGAIDRARSVQRELLAPPSR
jgi:tetratricopeptide (TPR) repeat protein